MLKVLVFIVIFLGVIPVGTVLARNFSQCRFFFFAVMVFLTCTLQLIHIAPDPNWTGTARGFALSTVDIASSILLLSMVIDPKFKVSLKPPGTVLFWIYSALTFLSVINAVYVLQWGFEMVKMFWMYIFFLAAYNYLVHVKKLWPLIYLICGIILFMLVIALKQKYLSGGYYQIPSTLPHQNSLALYSVLFGSLLLGILLNEKSTKYQTVLVGTAFLSTIVLCIFTYSRGGLFCYLFAISCVMLLSMLLNGISGRLIAFTTLGVIGVFILSAIAAPRIINRFQNAPEASKLTRINLAKAAIRIANDYTFGVGANNFSAYSGPFKNYAVEQHANLKITEKTKDFGGIVETTYLLVAAECGWITLVVLLVWFGYYFVLTLSNSWFLRNQPCFGVSIGILGGLLSNYLQSTMEWVLKQYSNYYQLMLIFALIAAIYSTRKAIKTRKS